MMNLITPNTSFIEKVLKSTTINEEDSCLKTAKKTLASTVIMPFAFTAAAIKLLYESSNLFIQIKLVPGRANTNLLFERVKIASIEFAQIGATFVTNVLVALNLMKVDTQKNLMRKIQEKSSSIFSRKTESQPLIKKLYNAIGWKTYICTTVITGIASYYYTGCGEFQSFLEGASVGIMWSAMHWKLSRPTPIQMLFGIIEKL